MWLAAVGKVGTIRIFLDGEPKVLLAGHISQPGLETTPSSTTMTILLVTAALAAMASNRQFIPRPRTLRPALTSSQHRRLSGRCCQIGSSELSGRVGFRPAPLPAKAIPLRQRRQRLCTMRRTTSARPHSTTGRNRRPIPAGTARARPRKVSRVAGNGNVCCHLPSAPPRSPPPSRR